MDANIALALSGHKLSGNNVRRESIHFYFHHGKLKPRYNKPRNSEFLDIVNKIQPHFEDLHITFDIVNYSI